MRRVRRGAVPCPLEAEDADCSTTKRNQQHPTRKEIMGASSSSGSLPRPGEGKSQTAKQKRKLREENATQRSRIDELNHRLVLLHKETAQLRRQNEALRKENEELMSYVDLNMQRLQICHLNV